MHRQEYGIECNHEPCTCLVTGDVPTGEAFCSDFCTRAAADNVESETCSCGHPPCDAK
jgi:hypothetical protein